MEFFARSRTMLAEHRTIREGLAVGGVAYVAVALFYSAFDVLAARGPVFTVNMLGRAVFRGLRDPAVLLFPTEVDWTAVFWYNGLHLLLSLAIGLIVSWMIGEVERHPTRTPLVLLAVVVGGAATVLIVGSQTAPMRPVLPWWSITIANVLASLLGGLYLLGKHPGLRRRLGRPWNDSHPVAT
jgi:hypothetical protein